MKIEHLKYKTRYFLQNWRMCAHLLIRTKRFGVNNKWWCSFDSIFGWPAWKIILGIILIRPIIVNYRMMRYRARIGFISLETLKNLGWDK